MTERISRINGITYYKSDNGLLGSDSKEKVMRFEELNIQDKFFFHTDYKYVIEFMGSGNCLPLNDYLTDKTKVFRAVKELEKDLKRGNYNPMKVKKELLEFRESQYKKLGYE